MSGRAGARGYLVQAVIGILDALDDYTWNSIELEPQVGEDKVDLRFRSPDGDRVSQIKSSENPIGAAQIRKWAADLEQAYPGALQYELRLIGPLSGGAASESRVGNVDVPTAEALNLSALVERCAHRLDRLLRSLGHGATQPAAREILAEALATRLGTLAAVGQSLTRHALERLLASWVAELMPARNSSALRVPRELPGAPSDFIGRQDELTFLRNVSAELSTRAVVISGLTGVGKSVLAASAASDLEPRYPDGQVYLDLRRMSITSRNATRIVIEVIQAFIPSYQSHDDAARCLADFRSLLNGRRVLILADNVETAEEVADLMPPVPGSLLIATTQSRFDLPGAAKVSLDVLSDPEGVALAQSIAPRTGDMAGLLAGMCSNHPLAIRIACGTLNARPDISPEDFITRLSGIGERAKLVRAALDLSLAMAPKQVKRFLTALSVFSLDFDMDAIASVWDGSRDQSDDLVAATIGRHLVEWDDKRKRYHLHDLVQAYILELTDHKLRSLFATRHAYYYAELCCQIEQQYRKGGESSLSALHLFDSEAANIAGGFLFSSSNAATDESAAQVCTSYARGLIHVMDLRLSPLARADVLLAGLEAARKLKNTGLIVLHTGNLGRVYRELGELELSLKCHHKVLEWATKDGFVHDRAYALHHIGLAHLDKEEYFVGIEYLEKSLAICGDPTEDLKFLEASTLNNLGNAYLRLGRPAKALDYLRPALDLQQKVQDPRMLSLTMINLGKALVSTHTEPSLAVEMLTDAAEIAEDIGDLRGEFIARGDLASALAQAGRPDDAVATAKALFDDAAATGHTPTEVDALETLGEVYLGRGEVELARKAYEQLVAIAGDRDFPSAASKSLEGFARIALHEGQRARAIEYLQKRLTIASGEHLKATLAWRIGELLAEEGNLRQAQEMMGQAIPYFTGINHERVAAMHKKMVDVETKLAD